MIDFGNRTFRSLDNDLMDGDSAGSFLGEEDLAAGERLPDPGDWCSQAEATLVTSKMKPDVFAFPADEPMHMPVIDIDLPCDWVPSTEADHGHLYIHHPVTFKGLIEILEVLNKHGIVQDGYLRAAKARGYSAVRMPGLKKPASA